MKIREVLTKVWRTTAKVFRGMVWFFQSLKTKHPNLYVLCQGAAILFGVMMFFVLLLLAFPNGAYIGGADWSPVQECVNSTRMYQKSNSSEFCIREKVLVPTAALDSEGRVTTRNKEEWKDLFCNHQQAVQRACKTGVYVNTAPRKKLPSQTNSSQVEAPLFGP